jgi:hypothetical protein
LTSRSLPWASSSSCQPGKVASSSKQMNAKIIAMILFHALVNVRIERDEMRDAYIKYGNTIMSLN